MNQSLYNSLREIVFKITKGDERTNDLFHEVMIQLLNNKKYQLLNDNDKRYYFTRAILNQYYSNTSFFHKNYKKHKFIELDSNIDIVDEEYDELPTLSWIYDTLEQELIDNPDSWYNIGLFKLYLELKKISKVHLKTKIPKYSIRITIKEMKEFINIKWLEYKSNDK